MSRGAVLRVGLTGGIGSGKSTLAGMLAGFGVPVLDLDALGRELHADAACRRELLDAFGEDILDADGMVDRGRLGRAAFADEASTLRLNGIMHPRIRELEEQWCVRQQAPYVLIEASVLIESGGAARMDAVVVVMAGEQLRRQRVATRPGMDAARFDAIVARQCRDAERLAAADFVVDNEAGLDALGRQAEKLHATLLAAAQLRG